MVTSQPGYGAKTLTMFPDLTTFNLDTVRLLIYLLIFWWNDANGL